MRVIAGKARGTNLYTLPGKDTRPTTDRIKETLFNILQPDIRDCRFLDLFAGSGAIGIEALSRGAREAVFIEKNKQAAVYLKKNLENTRVEEQARVFVCDMEGAVAQLRREAAPAFDLIFMDPPYGRELEKQALAALRFSGLVSEDTRLIVEADIKTDFSYTEGLGYRVERIKTYKTNQHVFLSAADDI